MRRGDGATASLCAITALPAEAPSLLASGEASGELSAALRNIAVLERDRAGASVRRAGIALRTLLMGAAVLAVAWFVFSVFSRAYRF
ncbi:MAG: hypothetical protein HMLKMBBP_03347 [Planctomycetes bacterium]|nr:hypothetical protein [Planctomycetota bacterium]